MRTLLLAITFLITSSIIAQNKTSEIDSLKAMLKSTDNDSVKMLTYNKLRRATYYYDAKTSKNYTKLYLEYAQKLKDSHNIALGHFFLGNAEVISSSYDEALSNYLVAGNYYETKKDSARLCSVLNSIGAVHEKTQNDSLSLVYYHRSFNLSTSLGDDRRSGIAAINIGNIYNKIGDIKQSISYLEKANQNLSKNPNHISFLVLGEHNLASAYIKNKEYNKAQKLYNDLLKKIDTVNDSYNYANTLRGLGNIQIKKNKPLEAISNLEKAYQIFLDNNFEDESFQVLPELISVYKQANKPQKALDLFTEYDAIKDSILSEKQDKNIAEAVQKYETEKKDTELKLLKIEGEKKEQQKRLYSILAIAGICIASLLGFFGYKNRQKNITLAKQKTLLEHTLDEKNTLLKEVHHRVKNSFQIVSSLLYLQSENIEDKEAKIAIKEAENRVRSMVLVHQKLYNKDELVGINTEEYFNDLVKDIIESHHFKTEPIAYELNVESHVLDIETITPMGLILNELIVNTLKHAFNKVDAKSKLIVNFEERQNELVLEVIDNGQGFEGEIKNTSFGIKLMKALSKKLKADLHYDSEPNQGTTAKLSVKKFNILT